MLNNQVIYVGRLTKDIELKTAKSGKVYTNFSIAVDLPNEMKTESRKADFFNCTAFGKAAEILDAYTKKGDKIMVSGSNHTNNYENGSTKVFSTKLSVREVYLLENKSKGDILEEIPLTDKEYEDLAEEEEGVAF